MAEVHDHSGISRAAALWVSRLTSGNASQDDVAAAKRWCEQSPSHRAAFDRAREIWVLAVPTQEQANARHSQHVRAWASAAALAAVALLVALIAARNNWTADYRTSPSEQRTVTLADGSSVLLDADSALDVEYTPARRILKLRAGQALFKVKHDANRPFVVQADETSATALGTVYSVARRGDSTEVVVEEGVVGFASPGVRPVRVVAGERLRHEDASTQVSQAPVDTSKALAWQRGVLTFELARLEDVVAELNRHRRGHIFILNARLRALKVSGLFRLDNLDAGLETLQTAFPIQATSLSPYFVVLR